MYGQRVFLYFPLLKNMLYIIAKFKKVNFYVKYQFYTRKFRNSKELY